MIPRTSMGGKSPVQLRSHALAGLPITTVGRIMETMDTVRSLIPLLIPILILELGLIIFALRDLSRRERVNGPKWMWVVIIVLLQLIGPILYFTVGRRDA
jgi:hypothetical protein